MCHRMSGTPTMLIDDDSDLWCLPIITTSLSKHHGVVWLFVIYRMKLH